MDRKSQDNIKTGLTFMKIGTVLEKTKDFRTWRSRQKSAHGRLTSKKKVLKNHQNSFS